LIVIVGETTRCDRAVAEVVVNYKNMKKFPFKPKLLGLLVIGIVVVFIGAIAKITKENFASNLLLLGLLIELIGVIYFFRNYKAKKRVNNREV